MKVFSLSYFEFDDASLSMKGRISLKLINTMFPPNGNVTLMNLQYRLLSLLSGGWVIGKNVSVWVGGGGKEDNSENG